MNFDSRGEKNTKNAPEKKDLCLWTEQPFFPLRKPLYTSIEEHEHEFVHDRYAYVAGLPLAALSGTANCGLLTHAVKLLSG